MIFHEGTNLSHESLQFDTEINMSFVGYLNQELSFAFGIVTSIFSCICIHTVIEISIIFNTVSIQSSGMDSVQGRERNAFSKIIVSSLNDVCRHSCAR